MKLLKWSTVVILIILNLSVVILFVDLTINYNQIFSELKDENSLQLFQAYVQKLLGWLKVFRYVSGLVSIFTSLLFLVAGIKIQQWIKEYFPDFYLTNNRTIRIASLGLFISLFLNGVLDLVEENREVKVLVYTYVQYYNLTKLIFQIIIPIIFQFSSLVFGYIRKKNNDKYRLMVQRAKEYGEVISSRPESLLSSTQSNHDFFDPPLMSGKNSSYTSPSSGLVTDKNTNYERESLKSSRSSQKA